MQELNGPDIREPMLVDYLRLGCAAALWGSTFLCNEIALRDFSPPAIAAYRIILAALLLLAVCFAVRQKISLNPRTVGLLVGIGILNSIVPFTLIGWGQLRVDSSTTGILLASSPFATLLLSHFMTRDDRFAWSKLFGLLLGFTGVFLLLGQGFNEGSGSFTAMLAIILAGCCYALSSILIRRLGSVPSLALAAGTLCTSGVVILPLLLWLDPPWQQNYRFGTITALLFLAVGPTAVGYVLRAQIVKLNGAVFMSNVGYLIPLFAVIWGWLMLSYKPTGIMLIALCLILAGVAIGQNKFRQLFRRRDTGA